MVGIEKKRNTYICTYTKRYQLQGAIFRDGRERPGIDRERVILDR
jgi:hypothetical protein